MIQEALDYVDHRVTVYVGTGGTVFEECVELSRFALDRGADGVMVISPYYFNLPDSSILNFTIPWQGSWMDRCFCIISRPELVMT